MKAERNRAASEKSRKATEHTMARGPIKAPGFSASAEVPEVNWDLRGQISIRAYELYVQRGCQEGHDLEDWLEAEREVLGREELADREVFSGSQA